MNIDITIGLDGKPDKGLNIVLLMYLTKGIILVGIAPLKRSASPA